MHLSLLFNVLHCGVPASSIAIITPDKGQKMAILKRLRKVPGATIDTRGQYQQVHYLKGKYQQNRMRNKAMLKKDLQKAVDVSTVRRYQGDENDIVILSLVCTKPGNRFAALRNRFIVAASRARIGFFMLGSSEALIKKVNGRSRPSHWHRFLEDLGYSGGNNEGNTVKDSRVGGALATCCPRHANHERLVSNADEFPKIEGERHDFQL